jgi:26S proteasome regulatory subunit T4
MLQIILELNDFNACGNIKLPMATNRPNMLDPALLHPGHINCKVEFGLPC